MAIDFHRSSSYLIFNFRKFHTSAKSTGILLEYGEGVSEAGVINYVCVQALFYGNDGVKNTPCIFADNKFQGSTFVIKFSAGGVS